MLTQEQITAIDAWFSDEVQGGVCEDVMGLIDRMIDENAISQKDYNKNETAICFLIDSRWFTCAECGWTQPVENMTNDEEHDWTCTDCNPDVH